MSDATVTDADVPVLVAELKRLRQRAAVAGALELGPVSRIVFGVGEAVGAVARAVVISRLRAAVAELVEERQSAVAVAFGLDPAFPGRHYRQRVQSFAAARGVDPRTVRRWVDYGLVPLARSLCASAPAGPPSPPWWTENLTLVLLLGTATHEVLEMRRVVAARDGLDRLDLSATLGGAHPISVPDRVSFDVFYGGTLSVGAPEAVDRIRLDLRPPRPLAHGEKHEYLLRTRIPAEHDLRHQFVYVPRYHCARLEVRVRFPQNDVPHLVHALENVFQRDIDDPVAGSVVAVDDAGEVRASFRDIVTGLTSGVRWRY